VASFPYFNGTGSAYLNRRNNEARAHVDNITVDIRIFLQCTLCTLDAKDCNAGRRARRRQSFSNRSAGVRDLLQWAVG